MNNIFGANFGGRHDMGKFGAPAFGVPVKMGCELVDGYGDDATHPEELDEVTLACKKCKKKHRSAGRMGQIRLADPITDAAKAAYDALLSAIGTAITAIPASAAGAYSARLQSCQDMANSNPTSAGYVAAAQCLRTLYNDIQNGTSTALPALPPPASSFPVIPVAIGALVVLGLVFYLTRDRSGAQSKKSK